MHELEDARSRIIAAADAERRRIERDLHDGAQQRLVALALNLRMAEQRVESGDPGAAELVRQAGEEANLALKELRDLARGIHPAILTNRGLPAALDDLASRATVPVEVVAKPDERLPDSVEAAAYFVVSECLANIGKHAEATSATVAVRADGGHLTVEVADDGRGGAALDGGSGVQGLLDRVGALSGNLDVESPPGEGTRVMAAIPLTGRRPRRPPRRGAPRRPVDRGRGANPRGAQAASRLQARLTGRGRGRAGGHLGAHRPRAALDRLAAARPGPDRRPRRVARVLGAPAERGRHRRGRRPQRRDRQVTKRRRLRHHIGAHAILNIFIVGVWVAANGTYFWPAWVMLGSAAAIAIKALPRGAAARSRSGPARAPRQALESTPR